ncbi:MAG TPA: hypothetical protein VIK61_11130 [Acidimicrobiia bacterium]
MSKTTTLTDPHGLVPGLGVFQPSRQPALCRAPDPKQLRSGGPTTDKSEPPALTWYDTRPQPQTWLCRSDDHHTRFAYARVHDFYRASDHALWAHLRDGQLISARSGHPLAYQIGSVFYDTDTDQPIYQYEPDT